MERNLLVPFISLLAIGLALAGFNSSTMVYMLLPRGLVCHGTVHETLKTPGLIREKNGYRLYNTERVVWFWR